MREQSLLLVGLVIKKKSECLYSDDDDPNFSPRSDIQPPFPQTSNQLFFQYPLYSILLFFNLKCS